MSYDEAVEAAAEALSRLWVEGGFASNDELARAALDAALPHLRNEFPATREADRCAGYGHFPHNQADAEATLAYVMRLLGEVGHEVRATPDAPTDPASDLEVPADDASAVGEPDEQVVEAVARTLCEWYGGHSASRSDDARNLLAVARDAGWQGRVNEMLERLEQVQSTWGFPVELPAPGGRLYTEQEVGDLQAREAELVSRPLREKIAHLEQRALKAEAALADAKREGAIEALEEAAEVIPGSDSGIGAVDPYDLAADWLARCAARLRAEGQDR